MPEAFPIFRRFRAPRVGTVRLRERFREPRTKRGYDNDWDKLRTAFIAKNPFCRFCEQEGREITPATTVDHIVPVEDRPDLRLKADNLQGMCDHHHYGTKAKLQRFARERGDIMLLIEWCSSLEARLKALGRKDASSQI